MINDLSKPGLIARKIEDEGLVENRVQRSLLHVSLLLRDPLTIVHQVDLHVRICKKYFRFFIYFLHFFLAILNVGLLEKRHWKQLHKKELHFSFCQEAFRRYFLPFLNLSPLFKSDRNCYLWQYFKFSGLDMHHVSETDFICIRL